MDCALKGMGSVFFPNFVGIFELFEQNTPGVGVHVTDEKAFSWFLWHFYDLWLIVFVV